MAFMVPETIRSTATAGERLIFRTLKNTLPDDYIVYYEPEIRGKRPDFVIIGPDLGLIVLEVKDYTKNTLFQLNKDTWSLLCSNGEQKQVKSPYKQAKDYMFLITDSLKKDSNLVHTEGKYQFQLKFPYGYGAVFTRLTQAQIINDDLYHVMDVNFTLTRDEIDPDNDNFSEEIIIEKIMNMFTVPYRLREPLNDQEIQAIRYHLFPEVRISAEFKQPAPHQDQLLLSLHDIKTMDLHQENLAKQLGDKNRLIRGVAGSGKTLILASRAKLMLKENPDWKILVLCFNISLANGIKQMIHHKLKEPESLFDFDFTNEEQPEQYQEHSQILIRNFHEWLRKDLKVSARDLPVIIEKLRNKEAILPTYDAILIDEGQDFEPEWLQLVSLLLNPETQSLLLVEDRAQNIYQRKRTYKQDTGLSFQGRSKILNINYRNTAQIVNFAWDFYQQNSTLKNKVVTREIDGIEIIAPQSTKRKGPEPFIYKAESFQKEMVMVAKQMKKLHQEKNVPYDEMLVLYRVRRTYKQDIVDTIQRQLEKEGVPHFWIAENNQTKREFSHEDGAVKISTIESSKGLDFQAVFIVNTENMPFKLEDDEEREVSLLYIGMTRAKGYLWISYVHESKFTRYFEGLSKNQSKTIEKKKGS